MNNERWVTAAFVTDALVADLLLRLKQSSPSPTPSLSPIGWGDRKSRSKPTTSKGQLQRSPSTPLSWSGGAGTSTSDGYDESYQPLDLYSGDRSVKMDLHQNHKNKHLSFKVESTIEIRKRQFMLPDLNETPVYEELAEP